MPNQNGDGTLHQHRFGPRTWSWAIWCLVAALIAGCTTAGPGSSGDNNAKARDCVGCHTDADLLKTLATPEEPPPEDTGEG